MRRLTPPLILATLAATAMSLTPVASSATDTRLRRFGSCTQLLDLVRTQGQRIVGGAGIPGQMPEPPRIDTVVQNEKASSGAVAGVDYSTTNVQEAGVDEPDTVKTDGTRLFVVARNRLHAIDVGAGPLRALSSMSLPSGRHELLLEGDRLLVLSQTGPWGAPRPGSITRYTASRVVLTALDVSDRTAINVVETLELAGRYVTARLVRGTVRVVVATSAPQGVTFEYARGGPQLDAAVERNRQRVAESGLANWLPRYVLRDARSGATETGYLAHCRNVRRPVRFSGLGLVSVLTIDLTRGLKPVDSDGVLTDAQTVYASPQSLYVATESWDERPDVGQAERPATTALHKFDISARSETRYRGSGQVEGFLLSSWSLSEHRGVLRAATTRRPTWVGDVNVGGQSFVTTLRERAGRLETLGRVGGLGKGERIYAVRFIGDTGYVVTFRQVDPLYTLDLADGERPRVVGELKVPGYSAYLHPVGEDLLLGVGQDVTPEGRVEGAQLSLFDVSDPRRPTRLAHRLIPNGWFDAEQDHHAFLYWPASRLAILPFSQHSTGTHFTGAAGFRISRAGGIREVGRIAHKAHSPWGGERFYPLARSVVVRQTLYTLSEVGVATNDLGDLSPRAWVPFG
ncbi:MAG: beta-propeller domain-containing protein [Gaiellaceae bacterium]